MQIKDRILALRKAMGLTQEALATKASLRRTEINRLEKGGNQATSHAIRDALATGFGLSLVDLNHYLDGRISVRDAMARMGEVKEAPPSATPVFDEALRLLGKVASPAAIERARSKLAGRDSELTPIGCAAAIIQESKAIEEETRAALEAIERAQKDPRPTSKKKSA